MERALVALLADGHILLEGVPGLAKTLLIKTIGQAIQAGFPGSSSPLICLPSDLIGTRIYNPRTGDFSVQKGPIFSNMILADEVNRAPAKVQSALLEAMQEEQVTIWRRNLSDRRAVPRFCYTEPHRAGRHVSPPGGPGGPFHAQGRAGLPRALRRTGDNKPDDVGNASEMFSLSWILNTY